MVLRCRTNSLATRSIAGRCSHIRRGHTHRRAMRGSSVHASVTSFTVSSVCICIGLALHGCARLSLAASRRRLRDIGSVRAAGAVWPSIAVGGGGGRGGGGGENSLVRFRRRVSSLRRGHANLLCIDPILSNEDTEVSSKGRKGKSKAAVLANYMLGHVSRTMLSKFDISRPIKCTLRGIGNAVRVDSTRMSTRPPACNFIIISVTPICHHCPSPATQPSASRHSTPAARLSALGYTVGHQHQHSSHRAHFRNICNNPSPSPPSTSRALLSLRSPHFTRPHTPALVAPAPLDGGDAAGVRATRRGPPPPAAGGPAAGQPARLSVLAGRACGAGGRRSVGACGPRRAHGTQRVPLPAGSQRLWAARAGGGGSLAGGVAADGGAASLGGHAGSATARLPPAGGGHRATAAPRLAAARHGPGRTAGAWPAACGARRAPSAATN